MSKNIIARQVTTGDLAIAQRIRTLRQKENLPQNEAARMLGISFQQWQKYELGRNRISAARLISIANILNTTPHYLLGWSDD